MQRTPPGQSYRPDRRSCPTTVQRCRRSPPWMTNSAPTGLRFHDLRHSYATWLVVDGVPPNMVARVMGTRRSQRRSSSTPAAPIMRILPRTSCLAALSPALRAPSRASPAAKDVQLKLRGTELRGDDSLHHDPPAADRARWPDLAGELPGCVVPVRRIHELPAVRVNPPLCLVGHRVSLVQPGITAPRV